MPFSAIAKLADLGTQALASIRARLPGKNTELTSYLGATSRAWAMGLFGLQRTAEAIARESPPNPKTSDLGIQTWAQVSGVPSNAGGYGQNSAVPSTGGQAPVTGTSGAMVLGGQQLVGPDGVTIIELVGDVTIPATGSFAAVTPGSAGNMPVGTQLSWLTPPAGCDGSVTLSSPLIDGDDLETIPHLFGRLQALWQASLKGGANIDYEEWSEALAGVDAAYIYPRRGGTGTLDIIITQPGSGSARLASGTLIKNVQQAVNALMPTDVDAVNVMTASMPGDRGLTFHAVAFLNTNYVWDWDDTGGAWTVSAYNAGALTLTLDTAPDATLVDAVNNGSQPRIQVLNTTTGAPIVAEQVSVTAISGNVLTIANALSVAPTPGDPVYAGAYAATPAAQAILDYVNGLGPSRVSGCADIVEVWDDVASVWAAGHAALDVTDTDGTRMLDKLAGVNGLTIAIDAITGGTSADFVPGDTFTAPPELARAAYVIVTQGAP
jgi:uncharacterized phage protein gp47/JayE